LRFSVADTGVGIPSGKQTAIFEAFAQADGSTTRTCGGTGLGLAIAAQLIQKMQGRIWIESKVGEGTTFHFTALLGVRATPSAVEPADPRDSSSNLPDAVLIAIDPGANTNEQGRERRPAKVELLPPALRILVAEATAASPAPRISCSAPWKYSAPSTPAT